MRAGKAAPRCPSVLLLGLGLALAATGAAAREGEPLPEPLSLAQALAMADQPHPDLALAEALLAGSRAEREAAAAADDLHVAIEARARWSEPHPDLGRGSGLIPDHKLGLIARKQLYDFGRRAAREAAAAAEVQQRENQLLGTRHQRRVEILRSFFDVLLADLRFTVENEAQANAFVRLDRLRQRHELGQVSDVALLESESLFQETRSRRIAAQAAQRSSRARLGMALGRPGQLPSRVIEPVLPHHQRSLPDVAELQRRALEANPELLALRQYLAAAEHRLEAARAAYRPVLRAEVEAADHSRALGSNDRLRAGVVAEVPLFTAGRGAAETAKARAELAELRARTERQRTAVEQAVLDLWLELQSLLAQREEALMLARYRDLHLDRSRALYELEVRADLGDAMTRGSEARLRQAESEYGIALAWARLDALLGVAPDELVKNALLGVSE